MKLPRKTRDASGHVHRDALASDALSYDPATRDRLIAGASLPASLYQAAIAYRDMFARSMTALLETHDVLIAPATYGRLRALKTRPSRSMAFDNPARANLGLYTQPISFLGLPVVAAPLPVEGLPMGVQLIAAHGQDAALLEFAKMLEDSSFTRSAPCPEPL
jgi:aspartyl-tRNA(Asn)/glutamyl-tRNA(Gln) amidotransferase subunit A